MIQFEIINCGMKIFDVIGDGVENVHLVPILAFGSLSAACTHCSELLIACLRESFPRLFALFIKN